MNLRVHRVPSSPFCSHWLVVVYFIYIAACTLLFYIYGLHICGGAPTQSETHTHTHSQFGRRFAFVGSFARNRSFCTVGRRIILSACANYLCMYKFTGPALFVGHTYDDDDDAARRVVVVHTYTRTLYDTCGAGAATTTNGRKGVCASYFVCACFLMCLAGA